MSYRHNPYGATKSRKKGKKGTKKMSGDTRSMLAEYSKGSFYDQEAIEKKISEENQATSSSHQKIELEIPDDIEESIEMTDGRILSKPSHRWIVDVEIMQESLRSSAVCMSCHGELNILEEPSYRAGLGTKLHFVCFNEECCQESNGDHHQSHWECPLQLEERNSAYVLKCALFSLAHPCLPFSLVELVNFPLKVSKLHGISGHIGYLVANWKVENISL